MYRKIPTPLSRFRAARFYGLPLRKALKAFFFGGIYLRIRYRKERKDNKGEYK